MNARLMGVDADRQRPPPELRAHADAAHDQHLSCWPASTIRRRSSRSVEERPLRGHRSAAARSTSPRGKFVFSCTEAYLIENGKIGAPVKGATLIGNGPDVLTRVSMIGNDLALDPGIGTCGKDGQGVPVGVGQPTLRIDGLTVGGTAV